MSPKILFFDIDGTLLSEKTGKIPESAIEAVRKARENGHLAFINSGRTAAFLGGEIEKIQFDGRLCGCGTYIEYEGKALEHKTLTREQQKKVIDGLRSCRIDAILEGRYKNYFEEADRVFTERFREFIRQYPFPCGTWEEQEISFDKFFMLTNEKSDLEAFQKELGEEFDFIDRENHFYEVLPKGCSKAACITWITEYLGMSIEDTISFGDSNNDLPMFDCTAISVGMGNASKNIMDKVDYVTGTVEEDGIWHAMKHLGLI